MEPWQQVADAVQRRRLELGLSQDEAARTAGISGTTWRALEVHAEPKKPLTRTAIARSLGWTTDSIDRILEGKAPVLPERVVGSRLEVQGLGTPDLVIELPKGTEYDEGDTVYLVITVKGGSALADQLLANAPWASGEQSGRITFDDVDRLVSEGHALEVKIAGHDAPALVIGNRGSGKSATVSDLRAAAEKGSAAGARRASPRKPKRRVAISDDVTPRP